MIPAETLAWLRRELGDELRVADVPLEGTSHTNHRAWLGARELLVRRYTDAELLADDPWYSPSDEVAALRSVADIDLVTPELVAADVDGALCDVPTLVVTWISGAPAGPTDLGGFARSLAEPLRAIHGARPVERRYEPYFVSDGEPPDAMRPPSWSRDPSIWERAFDVASRGAPEVRATFIHRDYHPGNTVWRGDTLVGVIDWTTACVGPAEIDLAHMRVNLVWSFDIDTADLFLKAWREGGDDRQGYDPRWDVLVAVDWLSSRSAGTSRRAGYRRYEAFVGRALAEIGA